jgi:hypothetical protein
MKLETTMTTKQTQPRDPAKAAASLANLRKEAGVNSIARAARNQELVLRALARFGWLPSKQLAAFGWPNDKTARCCDRTLAALRRMGLVRFKARVSDMTRMFALTENGVAYVSEEYGVSAVYDTEFAKRVEGQFEHRALSNAACVWWKKSGGEPGSAYFTEYEIVKGVAPLHSYKSKDFEKIPDALFAFDGADARHKQLVWVEVERGHKKDVDQDTLVKALCHILSPHFKNDGHGLQVQKDGVEYEVVRAIIVCPTEDLKARFVEFLFKYLKAAKYSHDFAFLMPRLEFLDPATGTQTSVTQWAQRPEYAVDWLVFGYNITPPDQAAA